MCDARPVHVHVRVHACHSSIPHVPPGTMSSSRQVSALASPEESPRIDADTVKRVMVQPDMNDDGLYPYFRTSVPEQVCTSGGDGCSHVTCVHGMRSWRCVHR